MKNTYFYMVFRFFVCQTVTKSRVRFRLHLELGTNGSGDAYYGRLSISIMSISELLSLSRLAFSGLSWFLSCVAIYELVTLPVLEVQLNA